MSVVIVAASIVGVVVVLVLLERARRRRARRECPDCGATLTREEIDADTCHRCFYTDGAA